MMSVSQTLYVHLLCSLICLVSGVTKSKGKKTIAGGDQPTIPTRESAKSLKEVEEEQQKDDAEDQDDDGATENVLRPGQKISLNDF